MDAAALLPFSSHRIIVAFDTDPAESVRSRQPFCAPSLYRCPLDRIISSDTRGTWMDLQRRLPFLVEVMDRPSFRRRFPHCIEALPLIGLSGNNDLEVLLESHNLRDAAGLEDLAWLMETSLATRAPVPVPRKLWVAA